MINGHWSYSPSLIRHDPLTEAKGVTIAQSARAIADVIKSSPNISQAEIQTILTSGNSALKVHLDTPPKLNGDARDSAKKRWVDSILDKLEASNLLTSRNEITKLIPEMAENIHTALVAKHKTYIQKGAQLTQPDQQVAAADALRVFSRDPTNRAELVRAGVHVPLGNLIIGDKATKFTKENAAMALRNLSEDVANRAQLVTDGVDNKLRALLEDQQATDPAKEAATEALWNMRAVKRE